MVRSGRLTTLGVTDGKAITALPPTMGLILGTRSIVNGLLVMIPCTMPHGKTGRGGINARILHIRQNPEMLS